VNATQLKQQLENQGSIFQTSSDTEVLAHLIKRSGHFELKDQIKNALSMLKGAYAFLIMTEKEMIVALDPNGLRPLSVACLATLTSSLLKRAHLMWSARRICAM
jgi:amidophosphoribosyltransferase